MTKILNDTQRKLVEGNCNLIYSYLNLRGLDTDSGTEDWYGAAAVGLCKAALCYDRSKNVKFSTLAYVCMEHEISEEIRKAKLSVVPDMSLDYEYNAEDGNGGICLSEILPCGNDFTRTVYMHDAIRLAAKELNDRDKKMVDMIMCDGNTMNEVSKRFDVSRPTVSRVFSEFLKNVRANMAV